MIEFIDIPVDGYNSVIVARNKLYHLALDLGICLNQATRLATLISELSRSFLLEHKALQLKLFFSKHQGFYSLNLQIPCTDVIYQQYKEAVFFEGVQFKIHEEDKFFIEISLQIPDKNFVPNQEFIQEEKERLIQQSSGEMLHEIREKNKELNKALEALKTSSGMIQSEKMRALGDMTAGVAHELNNPMMGILNFIQYAIKHTEENDRKYRPLVDAEREVRRCQDIISNLLTFSRMKAEGEESYSRIKLSTLFQRILKLQAYKLRSFNIQVIEDYPDEEPEVKVIINKLQQVLLNLMGNAIDAMKEAQTREMSLALRFHEKTIELSVSDTGTGMSEETLDRIFEPFFTTKKAGQGTGLGLALSKSIVEEHHGSLTCQSEVGRGTCFTITLPLIETDNT